MAGLYGGWVMWDRAGQVGYRRTWYTGFGEPVVYIVKIVGAARPPHGKRYDVSRESGGYVGQAKTRDGAFRMAASAAKRRGFTLTPRGPYGPKGTLGEWVPDPSPIAKLKGNPMKFDDYVLRDDKHKKSPPRHSSGRRRVTVKGRIGRTIKTAPFAKYARGPRDFPITLIGDPDHAAKQREAIARLTGRFKKNPMSRKDFEYMAAVIADAQLQGAPVNVLHALTNFSVDLGKRSNPRFDADRFARRILQLVSEKAPWRYVNKNPRRNPLAIYGANPPRVKTVRELGRVIEIRYKRKDDGKFYKHGFKTRPRLLALSDGTIAVRP